MDDLISRQALIKALNKYAEEVNQDTDIHEAIEIAINLPTIQPKTGRWIPTGYDGYADGNPVYDWWECSECGWEHTGDEDTLTPYCPNCGTKMQ